MPYTHGHQIAIDMAAWGFRDVEMGEEELQIGGDSMELHDKDVEMGDGKSQDK
jgi:hypothetical protein